MLVVLCYYFGTLKVTVQQFLIYFNVNHDKSGEEHPCISGLNQFRVS